MITILIDSCETFKVSCPAHMRKHVFPEVLYTIYFSGSSEDTTNGVAGMWYEHNVTVDEMVNRFMDWDADDYEEQPVILLLSIDGMLQVHRPKF